MVINKYIDNVSKEYNYYFENELSLLDKDKKILNLNFIESIDFQFNEERLRHGCRITICSYDKRKKLFSCRLNGFNVFMKKEEVFKYFN